MRVLILGGTGSVGSAVVGELLTRGHAATILCRSDSSADRARELGAAVLHGSISTPADWVERLSEADAVIHLATGFGPDAGDVDRSLLNAIFAHAASRTAAQTSEASGDKLRLIYTGGLWLFGSCSAAPDSRTPYNAPSSWQWATDGCLRVLSHPDLHGMVIHPANVTDEESGVPPLLLTDASASGRIRIPIPEEATWPLVRRDHLARLYAEVLEHAQAGTAYFGVSEAAVPQAELVRRTARATGLPPEVAVVPIAVWQTQYGEWSIGYSLSQKGTPTAHS